MKNKVFSTYNIAVTAVLLAIVVLLQVLGSYIPKIATTLSFVLVPVVLGSIVVGWGCGAFLGFMFGLITVITGIHDPFTSILLNNSPVLTICICILKGTLAGIIPGLLFKLISKKNVYAGVIVASLSAPVINTGIFLLGMIPMQNIIVANGISESLGAFVVAILLSNFILEFVINIVLAPALYSVFKVVSKKSNRKRAQPVANK